jgi:hypothetical protein
MLRKLFGKSRTAEPVWPSDGVAGLNAALTYIAGGAATFAIFTIDEDRNQYVQVSGGGDGLHAEAVGDRYLKSGSALSGAQADALRAQGWTVDPRSGNWTRSFDGWPESGSDAAVEALAQALEVYGWRRSDPLKIESGT